MPVAKLGQRRLENVLHAAEMFDQSPHGRPQAWAQSKGKHRKARLSLGLGTKPGLRAFPHLRTV
jgi:hypothetical protein